MKLECWENMSKIIKDAHLLFLIRPNKWSKKNKEVMLNVVCSIDFWMSGLLHSFVFNKYSVSHHL